MRAEAKRGISSAPARDGAGATELNARMQHETNQKIGLLQGVLAEHKASTRWYREIAAELGMEPKPRGR